MFDRPCPCWDEPIKEAVNQSAGWVFSDPPAGRGESRPCALKKGLGMNISGFPKDREGRRKLASEQRASKLSGHPITGI